MGRGININRGLLAHLLLFGSTWSGVAVPSTFCTKQYSLVGESARLQLLLDQKPAAQMNAPPHQMTIVDRATGERLGTIIAKLDRAGVGHIVSVSVRGDRRGEELGPEAEAVAIQKLFDEGKAREIVASLSPTNERSVRAHEKIGFKPFGPPQPGAQTYRLLRADFDRAMRTFRNGDLAVEVSPR